MPRRIAPTSQAVADALTHFRQMRHLSIDELALVLDENLYPISASWIRDMEECERAITVDDLMAFSYALDVSPSAMLAHVPIHMPFLEGPYASGVPSDIDILEIHEWTRGETHLTPIDRYGWWAIRVQRLRIALRHHEDQLAGAQDELESLGDFAIQEAAAVPIQLLHDRILTHEHQVHQLDIALSMAEGRRDELADAAR